MKLLFLVSGLGMGNASRTSAIVESLLKENPSAEISIACSGRGLEFLTAYFQNKKIEFIPLYPYRWRKSRAALIADWIRVYIKNCFLLRRVLKQIKPTAVILDSDYHFLAWLRLRSRTLYIGQAFHVLREARKLRVKPLGINEWLSFFFGERLDYFFQRIVASEIIVPCLIKTPDCRERVHQIGLIVRDEFRATREAPNKERKLAIPSGSGIAFSDFKEIANKLGFEMATPPRGLVLRSKDIETAECLLIQGGLSSISEALALNIPFLIAPIPGRFEQRITAISLERAGFGQILGSRKAPEKPLRPQEPIAVNGAEEAAKIIQDKALTL